MKASVILFVFVVSTTAQQSVQYKSYERANGNVYPKSFRYNYIYPNYGSNSAGYTGGRYYGGRYIGRPIGGGYNGGRYYGEKYYRKGWREGMPYVGRGYIGNPHAGRAYSSVKNFPRGYNGIGYTGAPYYGGRIVPSAAVDRAYTYETRPAHAFYQKNYNQDAIAFGSNKNFKKGSRYIYRYMPGVIGNNMDYNKNNRYFIDPGANRKYGITKLPFYDNFNKDFSPKERSTINPRYYGGPNIIYLNNNRKNTLQPYLDDGRKEKVVEKEILSMNNNEMNVPTENLPIMAYRNTFMDNFRRNNIQPHSDSGRKQNLEFEKNSLDDNLNYVATKNQHSGRRQNVLEIGKLSTNNNIENIYVDNLQKNNIQPYLENRKKGDEVETGVASMNDTNNVATENRLMIAYRNTYKDDSGKKNMQPHLNTGRRQSVVETEKLSKNNNAVNVPTENRPIMTYRKSYIGNLDNARKQSVVETEKLSMNKKGVNVPTENRRFMTYRNSYISNFDNGRKQSVVKTEKLSLNNDFINVPTVNRHIIIDDGRQQNVIELGKFSVGDNVINVPSNNIVTGTEKIAFDNNIINVATKTVPIAEYKNKPTVVIRHGTTYGNLQNPLQIIQNNEDNVPVITSGTSVPVKTLELNTPSMIFPFQNTLPPVLETNLSSKYIYKVNPEAKYAYEEKHKIISSNIESVQNMPKTDQIQIASVAVPLPYPYPNDIENINNDENIRSQDSLKIYCENLDEIARDLGILVNKEDITEEKDNLKLLFKIIRMFVIKRKMNNVPFGEIVAEIGRVLLQIHDHPLPYEIEYEIGVQLIEYEIERGDVYNLLLEIRYGSQKDLKIVVNNLATILLKLKEVLILSGFSDNAIMAILKLAVNRFVPILIYYYTKECTTNISKYILTTLSQVISVNVIDSSYSTSNVINGIPSLYFRKSV